MAIDHNSFIQLCTCLESLDSKHSVDGENSGAVGQLGSPASVSSLTQGGRKGLLCVWGSLAGNSCGSRLLLRAALPSRLLLPMHTNGLASHPRQPLLLLSSLSSHTRLGLRSICSPHSRHAHASEPLSPQVRACERTHRLMHLSGSRSPAPTRQNLSIPSTRSKLHDLWV